MNAHRYVLPTVTVLAAVIPAVTLLSFFAGLGMLLLATFGLATTH